MTSSLQTLLADDSKPLLWLDYWAYTRRLLRGGASLPWFDSTELDSFVRKSDALVGGSLLPLPGDDFFRACLSSRPELASEMAAKRRVTYPLKAFLRDEKIRAGLANSIEIIATGVRDKPIVLNLPSPRELVAWAFESAHGRLPDELTEDHADAAAMYLADLLDSLAATGLSGILLEESPTPPSPGAFDHLEANRSVLNVAKHLRWAVGLNLENQSGLPGDDFDFVIGPAAETAERRGKRVRRLDAAFFGQGEEIALQGADFYYAVIPPESVPEVVLERCAALRASRR